jgi:Arc/MetJ-type ribon-helix-helix transcriptional regulator
MAQININATPEFTRELREYMKARGFNEKSAAIRAAVHEALERIGAGRRPMKFSDWIGLAQQAAQNPAPRFRDEDALWEKP